VRWAAHSRATETLWGENGAYAATSRKGEYFRGEVGAVWVTVTNVAVRRDGNNPDIVTSITGRLFGARTPEVFGYDADGNMTNDGRWSFTWDAGNRLLKVRSRPDTPRQCCFLVGCGGKTSRLNQTATYR